MNRSSLWMSVVVLTSAFIASTAGYVTAEPTERVIKITAKAFEYVPNEITLKKGELVVLELTSQDLFHGFNISDLGLRADLPPGKTARVQLTPDKTGDFEFHCDNFCGIGHENMNGVIHVVE
ncbi:MAG TPA: cupredoxin domain-containing protein [Burkholderiales bacterium]